MAKIIYYRKQCIGCGICYELQPDLWQDHDERKSYASKLYWLVLVWLILILLIISFQGLKFLPGTTLIFKLSDLVLITLITTTTANIAAFFLVVVRYLLRPKR